MLELFTLRKWLVQSMKGHDFTLMNSFFNVWKFLQYWANILFWMSRRLSSGCISADCCNIVAPPPPLPPATKSIRPEHHSRPLIGCNRELPCWWLAVTVCHSLWWAQSCSRFVLQHLNGSRSFSSLHGGCKRGHVLGLCLTKLTHACHCLLHHRRSGVVSCANVPYVEME